MAVDYTKTPIDKDPNAVLDYEFLWDDWLNTSDVIVASTWVADVGITVTQSAFTDTTAKVWLSGGTVGKVYNIVNHVTTDDGLQDDRTLKVRVVQR